MSDHIPAILLAYFPGTEGGTAVAETLFGENDPSGRLPISIPRRAGDLPQHHDSLRHPTPIGDSEHPDSYDPLFRFGHGLSYTEFAHESISVTDTGSTAIDVDSPVVTIDVTVTNVGDRQGTETIPVYATPRQSARVRPERELVGFERVELAPGERRDVTVEISGYSLSYVIPHQGRVLESGEYEFTVNGESTVTLVTGSE